MFQGQIDAMKHDQYTITPDHLAKLRDQLQRYFLWVKTEMAPNGGNMAAPAAGASVGGVTISQAGGLSGGQLTNTTLSSGSAVAPGQPVNGIAGYTGIAGAGSLVSNVNANSSTIQQPATASVTSGLVVKHGLTPADLKLPPPKRTNNSPPNSSFATSPRTEPGGLGSANQLHNTTNLGSAPLIRQEHSKSTNPVSLTTSSNTIDKSGITTSESPTASTNLSKLEMPGMTSSQLLLAQRARALQQQQQQQQQQVSQGAQPQQLQQQQQPQLAAVSHLPQQQQHSPHPSVLAAPNGAGAPPGAQAKAGGNALESLSKDELKQQFQVLQRLLAGNTLPPNQLIFVKMQLQKIQTELSKSHRQEPPSRLGVGTGTSTAPNLALPATGGLLGPPFIPNQQISAQQPTATLNATDMIKPEVAPQLKDLQSTQEMKLHVQPVEPLEFLATAYKSLVGLDEIGELQDEGVAQESLFILHNTFEGFVGKRAGNGPGKDVYGENPLVQPNPEQHDVAVADMLLWDIDGQPDVLVASFVDWAQDIQTTQ